MTTSMPVAGSACASDGTPLVWKRQCISYSVAPRSHSTTPTLGELRDLVDRSFRTWSDVTCSGQPLALSLAQSAELSMCDKPEYNATAGNANTVLFVTDWQARKLPAEAFGLTMVWHDSRTGEIVDADMQLNETLGTLAICKQRCAQAEVDLQNIITHEAGHFLGLGHSQERTACMFGQALVGETSKRFLSLDDETGICATYAQLSQPKCAVSDYAPENGFSATCATLTAPQQQAQSCSCHTLGAERRAPRAHGWLAMLTGALWLVHRWLRHRRAHDSS
ncbi:MAG TPA: matrixin family metalloprotease [Polyangiales bacterium]